MRNHDLPSILDVPVLCPKCEWCGTVGSAEYDVDGEGSIGCPVCGEIVKVQEIMEANDEM